MLPYANPLSTTALAAIAKHQIVTLTKAAFIILLSKSRYDVQGKTTMALYEMQRGLSLAENYQAISYAQIDLAIKGLTTEENIEEGIYTARKCMKRLRGLLRLYKRLLKSEDFKRLNETYRDVGRSLSDLRDAWVRVELLDNLPDRIKRAPVVPLLRDMFLYEYEEMKQEFLQPQRYEPVLQRLYEARQEVSRLTLALRESFEPESSGTDLAHAIEDMLVAASKTRIRLRELGHYSRDIFEELLHEWRKRIKRIWYGMTLLRPLAPRLLDERIELYDHMGLILGDANDRHVLYRAVVDRFNLPKQALRLSSYSLFSSVDTMVVTQYGFPTGGVIFDNLKHKIAELHQKFEREPVSWLKGFPPQRHRRRDPEHRVSAGSAENRCDSPIQSSASDGIQLPPPGEAPQLHEKFVQDSLQSLLQALTNPKSACCLLVTLPQVDCAGAPTGRSRPRRRRPASSRPFPSCRG
jgi:CHAD domain-containing protein